MNPIPNTSLKTGATPVATDPLAKFNIPDVVKTKYADLIALVMETESMNDDERQYWFQIMPIMSEEQIAKLKKILNNEKEQLAAIDKKYQEEITQINDKHQSEYDIMKAKEARETIKQAEHAEESKEKNLEEDLIKRLNQA